MVYGTVGVSALRCDYEIWHHCCVYVCVRMYFTTIPKENNCTNKHWIKHFFNLMIFKKCIHSLNLYFLQKVKIILMYHVFDTVAFHETFLYPQHSTLVIHYNNYDLVIDSHAANN